jgi:hypothetical protein
MSRVPEQPGDRPPQLSQAACATKRRLELSLLSGPLELDEVLVVDPRSTLRPAQQVERKLVALLKSVYLPVSHVRTTTLYKGRGPFSVASAQSERTLHGAAIAYAGQ